MPADICRRTQIETMETVNYQLNEAKMFADITDGTAIIINAVTGLYYGMNGFGTSIFENLMPGSSTADILSATRSMEGVPDGIESSLQAFFDTLTGFEIVIPGTASSRPAVLNVQDAKADNFVPECQEYRDVQELLFADPIHEVKEDEGWQPEK